MKKTIDANEYLTKSMGPFSFAKLMRGVRTRHDYTQREMALRLHISVSHLSDIENGRKFVSVERAAEFAKRLKDS